MKWQGSKALVPASGYGSGLWGCRLPLMDWRPALPWLALWLSFAADGPTDAAVVPELGVMLHLPGAPCTV